MLDAAVAHAHGFRGRGRFELLRFDEGALLAQLVGVVEAVAHHRVGRPAGSASSSVSSL